MATRDVPVSEVRFHEGHQPSRQDDTLSSQTLAYHRRQLGGLEYHVALEAREWNPYMAHPAALQGPAAVRRARAWRATPLALNMESPNTYRRAQNPVDSPKPC